MGSLNESRTKNIFIQFYFELLLRLSRVSEGVYKENKVFRLQKLESGKLQLLKTTQATIGL